LQSDFDAHKAIEEVHERAEHGHGGGVSRNILLLAALIAVVAAIASLFANQAATAALQAKNDAILAQAKASDAYNFYQARSIKSKIYEAALISTPALSAALKKQLGDAAKHEARDQKQLLADAQASQKQVEVNLQKSEELMHSHEILEASVTFFEVAIAITSIAGITNSRFLLVVGLGAATIGVALAIWGFIPPTPIHAVGAKP
jgi:predicted lipoprotein with Yx(FWY)xxD motif